MSQPKFFFIYRYSFFFFVGNVTPIPTTGELEELSSVDEPPTVVEDIHRLSPPPPPPPVITEPAATTAARSTPLKSLLKKPSLDAADSGSSSSDSEEDGKVSPKKVHFSEIDQAGSLCMYLLKFYHIPPSTEREIIREKSVREYCGAFYFILSSYFVPILPNVESKFLSSQLFLCGGEKVFILQSSGKLRTCIVGRRRPNKIVTLFSPLQPFLLYCLL
jgi:hypothetical protein